MWACTTWIYHYKIICDNIRVRKYAKFGVFYAKIVQMTSLKLWTTTTTLCTPHDSVYMPGPHAGKSENGFFWLWYLTPKYSKMTPKFVKQKSHWLHSSIKFANPEYPRLEWKKETSTNTYQLQQGWLNMKEDWFAGLAPVVQKMDSAIHWISIRETNNIALSSG